MAGEEFASLDAAQDQMSQSMDSSRVEHRVEFIHGHAEVRRYCWSRPVADIITIDDDVISLNMALTSPANPI
jgi:hypothetical protein